MLDVHLLGMLLCRVKLLYLVLFARFLAVSVTTLVLTLDPLVAARAGPTHHANYHQQHANIKTHSCNCTVSAMFVLTWHFNVASILFVEYFGFFQAPHLQIEGVDFLHQLTFSCFLCK